jgi:hypothetical protein
MAIAMENANLNQRTHGGENAPAEASVDFAQVVRGGVSLADRGEISESQLQKAMDDFAVAQKSEAEKIYRHFETASPERIDEEIRHIRNWQAEATERYCRADILGVIGMFSLLRFWTDPPPVDSPSLAEAVDSDWRRVSGDLWISLLSRMRREKTARQSG